METVSNTVSRPGRYDGKRGSFADFGSRTGVDVERHLDRILTICTSDSDQAQGYASPDPEAPLLVRSF